MMARIKEAFRRLRRETRGQEIAEAALVLPLMFMVLLGIFWFGQAFSIYGTLTQAARQGVEAAVIPSCTTCAAGADPSANAYNAVQNALQAAHLDPSQLHQPSSIPALCACGQQTCTGSAVTCDGSQSNICIQGIAHNSGELQENLVQMASGTTGAGVCGVSVSFQYPFTFWLPFTSLNKQQIWIQGQAEMRAETQ